MSLFEEQVALPSISAENKDISPQNIEYIKTASGNPDPAMFFLVCVREKYMSMFFLRKSFICQNKNYSDSYSEYQCHYQSNENKLVMNYRYF